MSSKRDKSSSSSGTTKSNSKSTNGNASSKAASDLISFDDAAHQQHNGLSNSAPSNATTTTTNTSKTTQSNSKRPLSTSIAALLISESITPTHSSTASALLKPELWKSTLQSENDSSNSKSSNNNDSTAIGNNEPATSSDTTASLLNTAASSITAANKALKRNGSKHLRNRSRTINDFSTENEGERSTSTENMNKLWRSGVINDDVPSTPSIDEIRKHPNDVQLLISLSVGIFERVGKSEEWESIDGGISTIAIYHYTKKKIYHLVALSIKQKYVINTWLDSKLRTTAVRDVFYTVHGLKRKTDYGFTFKNASDATKFVTKLNESLEKLKEAKIVLEKEANRQKIVEEIIQSEKDYCKYLAVIVKNFMIPLRENALTRKPVPLVNEQQARDIFINIEEILLLNERFLQSLVDVFEKDDQPIAEVFLKMRPSFDVYRVYYNGFSKSNESLMEAKKKTPALEKFLEEAKSISEAKRNPLSSLLIMPCQRIPRYILLLNELSKLTPKTHQDYDNIQKAIASFKELASYINESQRKEDSYRDMLYVYKVIEPKLNDLVIGGRYKIRESELLLEVGKIKKVRYCWLFNDIMLVTKQDDDKYWLKYLITLKTAKVSPHFVTFGAPSPTQFILQTPKKDLVFECKTKEEKEAWMKDLATTIWSLQQDDDKKTSVLWN